MSDLISRQDAIDALDRDAYRHTYLDQIIEVIKNVPSAQPEIIYCKDCMYYHPSFCEIWSKFGTVQTKENGFCYMAERREE